MVSLPLLLILVTLVSADWFWGGCPSPRPMPEFEPEAYTGLWHDVMRTKDLPYKTSGTCPRSYYVKEDDDHFSVLAEALYDTEWHTYKDYQYWTGNEGKLNVCSSTAKTSCSETTILDTDYETYSVIWSCHEGWFGLWHHEYSWVLARNIMFFGEFVEQIITDATSLEKDDLEAPENHHCPDDGQTNN